MNPTEGGREYVLQMRCVLVYQDKPAHYQFSIIPYLPGHLMKKKSSENGCYLCADDMSQ